MAPARVQVAPGLDQVADVQQVAACSGLLVGQAGQAFPVDQALESDGAVALPAGCGWWAMEGGKAES